MRTSNVLSGALLLLTITAMLYGTREVFPQDVYDNYISNSPVLVLNNPALGATNPARFTPRR